MCDGCLDHDYFTFFLCVDMCCVVCCAISVLSYYCSTASNTVCPSLVESGHYGA